MRTARPRPLEITGRALFYEGRGSSLMVDFITSPTSSEPMAGGASWTLPAGLPFTVEIGVPGRGWMDAALAALERWTQRAAELHMRVVRTVAGPRVQMSDSQTTIQFDLVALIDR